MDFLKAIDKDYQDRASPAESWTHLNSSSGRAIALKDELSEDSGLDDGDDDEFEDAVERQAR